MKIEFKNKGDYKEWALAMWNRGFNYPITNIPKLLGVSISWVKQNLLKHINYVVYDNKWIYKKTHKTNQTFIDVNELSKWIQSNAKFYIQTEIIDLAYHLKPYKKQYNHALKLYKEELQTYKNRGFCSGTIPKTVLDYINNNLMIINAKHNWSYKDRNKVKWVEIEPFNIFNNISRLYYIGDSNHSNITGETVYRSVFLNGDIKIKIGNQITLFYKKNKKAQDMKLPYLVPFGTLVKIYK